MDSQIFTYVKDGGKTDKAMGMSLTELASGAVYILGI